MKKIINGKKYDTETATFIGSGGNSSYLSRSDFNWYYEELYQKKTGEFFLYGESGPRGKYAEVVGNATWSGENIIPLTMDEARDWCERNLAVDTYEEIWGECDE